MDVRLDRSSRARGGFWRLRVGFGLAPWVVFFVWATAVDVRAHQGPASGDANASYAAKAARIVDIIVTNNATDLMVFSSLRGGFDDPVLETLQSGNPVIFTYFISLRRRRRILVDQEVGLREVHNSVRFDPLKKEYIYVTDVKGKGPRERRTKELQDVRFWMTELNGVRLGLTKRLIPGEEYYVEIKASLNKLSLFFPLNYLAFLWNRETKWARSPIFTPQAP